MLIRLAQLPSFKVINKLNGCQWDDTFSPDSNPLLIQTSWSSLVPQEQSTSLKCRIDDETSIRENQLINQILSIHVSDGTRLVRYNEVERADSDPKDKDEVGKPETLHGSLSFDVLRSV